LRLFFCRGDSPAPATCATTESLLREAMARSF